MICKVIADIISVDNVYNGLDVYVTGNGIANFKGFKNILSEAVNANVYEYKIPFNNSHDKFQTSKTGLVALAESII